MKIGPYYPDSSTTIDEKYLQFTCALNQKSHPPCRLPPPPRPAGNCRSTAGPFNWSPSVVEFCTSEFYKAIGAWIDFKSQSFMISLCLFYSTRILVYMMKNKNKNEKRKTVAYKLTCEWFSRYRYYSRYQFCFCLHTCLFWFCFFFPYPFWFRHLKHVFCVYL